VGTSDQSCLHSIICVNLSVTDSLHYGAMIFKSQCDAHASKDTMHMLMRYGAHDAGQHDSVTHKMS
jgi:hypothetical protein